MTKVLFISPTVPAPDGNGLAMRAGVSLDGLARFHDVAVAVVAWPDQTTSDAWTQERCTGFVALPLADDDTTSRSWLHAARSRSVHDRPLPTLVRRRPPALGERIADKLGSDFDALVVMRTYLAGVAVPFLEATMPALLDADDDEASSLRSSAAFEPEAMQGAERFEAFQNAVYPWFDVVTLAATDDALSPLVHLPNAVAIPTRRNPRPRSSPLELLFVGATSYLPNAIAVERLKTRIVPAITAAGIDVVLHHPGRAEPVAPYYEHAHIAVAPLASGSGTRIKVLEAFANGCPVVSTPTGARGLAVAHDEHLVVTETDNDDDAFVDAVIGLSQDDFRRARLAVSARQHVVEHHDRVAVGAWLAALVDGMIKPDHLQGDRL